jgi:hypothetical protein
MSSRMLERTALVGVVSPATHAVGTADTAAIDLKNFRRVMFVVMAGSLAGGGVIDFKVQSSDDPSGTFTDVSGLAIAPMNNADGTNSQAIVEVTADQLADGQRYVRGRLTISTAAAPVAVAAFGGDPRYQPIAPFDLTTVIRVVD